ncbi:hypothetical protein HII31_08633 [Pseudocercospora fuligena]|uniref:Uncharacterized protein n=1 Tax=Pseudocercospora fuligena TaxID=685502 RepID=A0A8H6VH50_9PEZI|nr:hypothetical protein HII31_08633 [Pseudocercospora fuligena]
MDLDRFDVRTDGVGNSSAQELMRPSRRFAVRESLANSANDSLEDEGNQLEVGGVEVGGSNFVQHGKQEVMVDYVLWYRRAVLCQDRVRGLARATRS